MELFGNRIVLFCRRNANAFFRIAQVGFVASLLIHISTYIGLRATMDIFWFMHVGMFVVWFPAIILARYQQKGPMTTVAYGMEKSPTWLKTFCLILGLYVIVNFALFMISMGEGGPDVMAGKFVLSSHGKMIKEITEPEYWHLKIMECRGFSGHWMIFYLIATSILLTQKRTPLESTPEA